ncbi:MAG: hypothetical protein JJT89_06830 [Nitriliruptoraceae bacterium]|nr:hypothetical protein [Nitriliruptoraceae bacterium]
MTARVAVGAAVFGMLATTLVLGEPSRPATAEVVRPIVTVQALCTAPTIVDVAAGEATRALRAVDGLLGVDDPVVLEAAREVSITDTPVGTFFVRIEEGELRVSILRTTGLPTLAPTGPDSPPQTFRSFGLPDGLAQRPARIVPADHGAYLVFRGADTRVTAIPLDVGTLTADDAELSASQAPEGVTLDAPAAIAGTAVAHDGVLWVAADDGTVWTYDAAVDPAERWEELDQGLSGGVLARDADAVYGAFGSDGQLEIRAWASPAAEPQVLNVGTGGVAVEAASADTSRRPGFVLRSGDAPDQLVVAMPRRDRVELTTTSGGHAGDVVTSAVLHPEATALLTDTGGELRYHVIDEDGELAGSIGRQPDEPACIDGPEAWPDLAQVVQPLSAGSLIHLHQPASQFDCVIDMSEGLDDLEGNCAPGGPWSVDKGAAPDSDFTVEIEQAIEEFRDELEDQESDEPEDLDDPNEPERDDAEDGSPESIEDEFAEAGLGIAEVDEDLTDVCAEEEVTAVVAPTLEDLEAQGDRSVRAEWTWSGGRCLPDRYLIDVCLVASDGSGCSEERTEELVDRDGGSNRLATTVTTRPGRSYRFVVTAVKQGVRSDPSNAMTISTPPATPAAPGNVSASLSSSGVWNISWGSCLDDRSCEQRPEAFEVTVEGCDGDSLSRQTHRLGAGERSVSYDISGNGFQGTDLLGRSVRFTVAASAAGFTSERVQAGSCTESTRPGRNVARGDTSVAVSLSGRTTSMSLQAPSRSAALTRLFGTSRYDDVSARLVRSSSSTGARSVALGGSASFEVARCELSGWTVELTPRRGGSALERHTSRITGVPAACDWAVTELTQAGATVTGGNADAITARVSIPGLADDVRTDKVDSVSAEVTCQRWDGLPSTPTASGASIDGNNVTFTVTTPAVFDIAGACTIAPRLRGTDGTTVVPRKSKLDLTPVRNGVVDRVGPRVVEALKGARTGEYRGQGAGNRRVVITHNRSGLGCRVPSSESGTSVWEIEVTGGRAVECSESSHRMEYGRQDLDNGRANITYGLRLSGGKSFSVTEDTNICAIPGGTAQLPCVPVCALNPDLSADDKLCVTCPWNDTILQGDSKCVEPEPEPEEPPEEPEEPEEPEPPVEEPPESEPCDRDPDLSADDPACDEPDAVEP